MIYRWRVIFSARDVHRSREDSEADWRMIAAAATCSMFEFFDFVVYAFFAVPIARAFFPAHEPELGLLLAVAVFWVGFIARPVGSIVIGRYADRTGRRPALLLSAALMAAATAGLALTPGYTVIGIAAPLFLTLWRLLQGFALGGEIGPSTAFLLEIAPVEKRASLVALQFASQGAAAVLAGLIGLTLSGMIEPSAMSAWGWRVPFAIGALLVPVACYLRWHMPETLRAPVQMYELPASHQLPSRSMAVLLGVTIIAGGSVATYVGNYMATYATTVLRLPAAIGLAATVAAGLATIAGALVGGSLADRYGRWPVIFWPRLATALLSVPAFLLVQANPSSAMLLLVSAILAFLTAVNGGGALTGICELFPTAQRATSLAVVYSIGVTLFGGSTQFVVTWVVRATGDAITPAWYVTGISVLALFATFFLPETRTRLAHANKVQQHITRLE